MSDKFSILYVDDEASNLRIFKNTFRREYKVFTAISAKEGLEVLSKESIDIILSDQQMPEMTGVEFLKYSMQMYPGLNRILITGFTDIVALQNAINDAKIFQYIQKPWQEEHLRTVIEKACNVYKLEIENKKLTKDLKGANKELVLINDDLKLVNDKLMVAKLNAEESDRLKSVFLNNISHEIRTPMNGIIGFSELLNINNISDEQRKEYRDIVISSVEQLMRIIEDIIEISSLAASNTSVEYAPMRVDSLLNSLMDIYKSKSAEKVSVTLINELSEDENRIISDKHKLDKVLSNIINNAIKYTHLGFVKISCKKINKHIEFCVEDSGIGIKSDMLKVIFDYFRQEEESTTRQFGGLGIGLSIVGENIKLLKGEIIVKSEKDKGSSFLIKIPYRQADNTEEIGKNI